MKGLYTVLIILGAVLLGYLIFNFTRARRQQVDFVGFEVSAESVKAYEQRIAELNQQAEAIRRRIARAPLNERLRWERKLAVLTAQIRDLQVAVEQWRQARTKTGAAGIYRQCILLYGKAAGVCELLLSDTLPLPQPKE